MNKKQLIPFDACKHLNLKELKAIVARLHNYNAHLRYDDDQDKWDISYDVDIVIIKINRYVREWEAGEDTPDLDDELIEVIKEFNLEHDFQILGANTDD